MLKNLSFCIHKPQEVGVSYSKNYHRAGFLTTKTHRVEYTKRKRKKYTLRYIKKDPPCLIFLFGFMPVV